jgi:hypothetical protein
MTSRPRSKQWAYYDADGNRVPPQSELAAFKAQAIAVDSGAPAPPGHASLGRFEFDAHPIGRPDLQRSFKSFAKMQAWFKEAAPAKSKGKR